LTDSRLDTTRNRHVFFPDPTSGSPVPTSSLPVPTGLVPEKPSDKVEPYSPPTRVLPRTSDPKLRAQRRRRMLELAPWLTWGLVVPVAVAIFFVVRAFTSSPPPAVVSPEDQFQAEPAANVARNCYAAYLQFKQDATALEHSSREKQFQAQCKPPADEEFGWGGQGWQEVADVSVVDVNVDPARPSMADITVSAMVNGPERICHVVTVLQGPEGNGIAEGPRSVDCPKVLKVAPPPFAVDEKLSSELKPLMQAFFGAWAGSSADETHTSVEQEQAALKQIELARLMANNQPVPGLPPTFKLADTDTNGAATPDKGIVAVKVAKASDGAKANQTGDRRRAKVTVRWVRPSAANGTMIETYNLTVVKRDDHWFIERLHEVQNQPTEGKSHVAR
jgi:hypothetical protein